MGARPRPRALRISGTYRAGSRPGAGVPAMVTATLPPYAQPGMRIDATVAAIGDCSNLQGGILVLTSLRGADGQIYAVAQGPVMTGGFAAKQSGSSQTVNHPTVGRAPDGAIVERVAPSPAPSGVVKLQLRRSDFTTAARIAEVVNKKFPADSPYAKPENAGLISIAIPPAYAARSTEFLSEVEALSVDADEPARVVVNERTGTITLGKDVRIHPVAILHGNLTVEIQTTYLVSQPNGLSAKGTTEVVPQTTVTEKEEKARNVVLKEGATVEDLVRALAAIGSTPRDVIAILQNLKSAGALDAELVVI